MSAQQLQKENVKIFKGTPTYYISLVIMLALMFLFRFLPPIGTITSTGMAVVGIFLGLIWGWSTMGLLVPSILSMIAFGFTSLYGDVTTVFTAGIGSQNVLIVLLTFGILGILQASGVTRWMALNIISLKIARGRPWVLALLLIIAAYWIQALTGSIAACLLVWTIFYDIVDAQKIEKGAYTQFVIFGVIFAAILSGQLFPFNWVVLTLTDAYTAVSGLPAPSFGPYVLWMLVIHAIIIALFMLICKYILRIKVPELNRDELVEKPERLDAFQTISLIMLAVFIVSLMIAGLFSNSAIGSFLNKFSVVGMAAVVLVILLGLNFTKCASLENYMATAVNWGLVFTVAAVSVLSSVMGSAECGIMDWVSSFLAPLLSDKGVLVFLILITLLPAVLTNFLNNLVMGVLFVPISYTMATALGLNSTVLCVMMIQLVSVGIMTAAGCQPAAVLHGNTEWITSPQAAKLGVIAILLSWLVTLIIGYPLGLLLF